MKTREIKQELQNAIIERFKLNKIVRGFEDQLQYMVQSHLEEKYSEVVRLIDGKKYKYLLSKGFIDCDVDSFEIDKMDIRMKYILTGDVSAEEQKIIDEVNDHVNREGDTRYYRHEGIVIVDTYECTVDDILGGKLSLNIDNIVK